MGRKYFEKISSSENEIVFANLWYNFILNIDPRITCDTTVSAEYTNPDTTHVPTFNFSINGKFTIQIKRNANLANYSLAYTVSCGTFSDSEIYYSTAWHNGGVYQNLYRELNIAALATDDFILIAIGGLSGTSYINDGIDAVWFTANDKNYTNITFRRTAFTEAVIFNISSKIFTETETSAQGTFTSRFPYKAVTGRIDYIKSSVYTNNGVRVFDNPSLFDCTTVSVGATVPLAEGEYYAVGTNQLIKMSE